MEVTLNCDADGVASVLNDLLDTDADAEPDADGRLPEWYLRVLSSAYTAERDIRRGKPRRYGWPIQPPLGGVRSKDDPYIPDE